MKVEIAWRKKEIGKGTGRLCGRCESLAGPAVYAADGRSCVTRSVFGAISIDENLRPIGRAMDIAWLAHPPCQPSPTRSLASNDQKIPPLLSQLIAHGQASLASADNHNLMCRFHPLPLSWPNTTCHLDSEYAWWGGVTLTRRDISAGYIGEIMLPKA